MTAETAAVLAFINSTEIINVINSWLNATKLSSSSKTITICNDTEKRWRFWVGDGSTRDAGLRWLDPHCDYVHTFTAYHTFLFNTNHLARIFCREDNTYTGFSVYNDGVPCENNLLVIQNSGVSFVTIDGQGLNKITDIITDAFSGDTGLYEVERMKNEVNPTNNCIII